jgi:hypothetical protein
MFTRITPILAGLVGCVLAAGCGDSLDVNNTNPKGSIGGVVVDAVTRMPIEGATVSVIAGADAKDPETTGTDGRFRFTNVPAGEVLISIDGPEGGGYQGVWLREILDDTAGDFPAQNTITVGPIGLIAPTDEVTVRVLDLEGQPVSMYTLTMTHFAQYIDFSDGTSDAKGEVVLAATTGTDGRATFQGLPPFFSLASGVNGTALIGLPPVQENGIYTYSGGAQTLDLKALGDPTPDIILDPSLAASLEIRASTIADLYDPPGSQPVPTVLPINGVVHVAFNLPIQNNATVTVMDEQGTPIANQPTVTISDDNITMSFGNNPLVPGNEYNLSIHAVSAVGEVAVSNDFAGAFFTPGLNDEVSVANVVRNANPTAESVHIEFSEPIGYATTGVIQLNGSNCPIFIDFDLNGAGGVGDATNERGNANCNLNLIAEEPDPPGIATRSGYTKFWRFTAPLQSDATTPLPSGTRFDLVFSKIVTATSIIERPDGRPVRDFVSPNDIPINP